MGVSGYAENIGNVYLFAHAKYDAESLLGEATSIQFLPKCETLSFVGLFLVKFTMVKPAPVSDHSVFNLLASSASDPIAIGCPTAATADHQSDSSPERDPLFAACAATESSPSHMIYTHTPMGPPYIYIYIHSTRSDIANVI
jgi:hypothetical protein